MFQSKTWSVLLLAFITSLLFGARLGPLAGLLLAAVYSDMKSHKVPNSLILLGIALAIPSQIFLPDGLGILSSLKGLGLGFLLFLPLYLMRTMGAGDVKLMAMVGAYLGQEGILGAILGTLLAGGVLALVYAFKLKATKKLAENVTAMMVGSMAKLATGKAPISDAPPVSIGKLPYALAIAIGTSGYILFELTIGK